MDFSYLEREITSITGWQRRFWQGHLDHHLTPDSPGRVVTLIPSLPKTRSGKILRATLQKIANGETYKAPATIDDPVILEEIHAEFKTRA